MSFHRSVWRSPAYHRAVADGNACARWHADGKFFRAGNVRLWPRMVTFGPFPGGWPEDPERELARVAAAGFHAVRLYEAPSSVLLDAALRQGLRVFGGLAWGQTADFFRRPGLFTGARVRLQEQLRAVGRHPALAGIYVANEIPADLVRWMGPVRVKEAIEQLIAEGKETAPELLFAYANYPSTEYLEPENADFTAFNVYLEEREAFRRYLRRLHHIAGDRPLVISEFGLDSRRNGLARQAETLAWALELAREEETAGLTLYAWSDRWWNAGQEVLDWDFGLTDRQGREKPALRACESQAAEDGTPAGEGPSVSVIVCTRNGRERIGACLAACGRMTGGRFEVIAVDDGSQDGTADFIAQHFPWVRLLRLDAVGLSAARNAGAALARGEVLAYTDDDCEPDEEWVMRLRRVFAQGEFAAVGGPNLAPPPRRWEEAVVCASPGAPSHVMLDDLEAEHLPGCNLAVTREAFAKVGGFDPVFRTAGDDVDFCWRLREAGYRLGFAPGAFVWHWRRPSVAAFLRQQRGYGRAERLLIRKHPQRFSKRGGTIWEGFVYGGGPVRVMEDSVIYFGAMGGAGYQCVVHRTLPLRGLGVRFDGWKARMALRLVKWLQPRLRAWERTRSVWLRGHAGATRKGPGDRREWEIASPDGQGREPLLQRLREQGWTVAADTAEWDLEKGGSRMLMATERGEGGITTVLVRAWGPSAEEETAGDG